MATSCPRCGGEIGTDGSCPRCAGNKTPPGGLLARRKAELDARWQQRVSASGLADSLGTSSFSTAPAITKAASVGSPSVADGNNELPQKRVDADVERVRFSGEHRFSEELRSLVDIPVMDKLMRLPDADEVRRDLKAGSLMLTETMAPSLYMSAKALARYFGIDEPVEIYQTAGAENAAMHFILSPVILEISGQLLPRTDELMLRALIGHELGHYLAHGQRNPLRDFSLVRHVLISRHEEFSKEAVIAASRFSMSQELTADRYGLLAARNLQAALRLEMAIVSGLSSDAIILDTDSYLAQARELMEHVLENEELARGVTHPEHSLRAYAQWLYWESDAFHALTGLGPGRMTIAEVDAKLLRLLGMSRLEVEVQPDSRIARLMVAGNSGGLDWSSFRPKRK